MGLKGKKRRNSLPASPPLPTRRRKGAGFFFRLFSSLKPPGGYAATVAFSPDGKVLVSGGWKLKGELKHAGGDITFRVFQ